MRPFVEAQSKVMRAYAQSEQYHTIVESRVYLVESFTRLEKLETQNSTLSKFVSIFEPNFF